MHKLLESIDKILDRCTGPAEAFAILENHKNELLSCGEEYRDADRAWMNAIQMLPAKGPELHRQTTFADFEACRTRMAEAFKKTNELSLEAERAFALHKRQEFIVAAIELHIQSMGWEKPLTIEDFVAQPPEECPPAVAVDTRPIPAGVFYHPDSDDFYQYPVFKKNQGYSHMGKSFWQEWHKDCARFPRVIEEGDA